MRAFVSSYFIAASFMFIRHGYESVFSPRRSSRHKQGGGEAEESLRSAANGGSQRCGCRWWMWSSCSKAMGRPKSPRSWIGSSRISAVAAADAGSHLHANRSPDQTHRDVVAAAKLLQ